MANNKNPNIVANAVVICGTPKKHNIPKYINVHNSVIKTIKVAAINFPRTTLVKLIGDVSNNCSVPLFLSSAKLLIVSIGTINVKIVAPE